jgi:hypothetical protein
VVLRIGYRNETILLIGVQGKSETSYRVDALKHPVVSTPSLEIATPYILSLCGAFVINST